MFLYIWAPIAGATGFLAFDEGKRRDVNRDNAIPQPPTSRPKADIELCRVSLPILG